MSDDDSFGSEGYSWLQMAGSSIYEPPPPDEEVEYQDNLAPTDNETWDPTTLYDLSSYVHVPAIAAFNVNSGVQTNLGGSHNLVINDVLYLYNTASAPNPLIIPCLSQYANTPEAYKWVGVHWSYPNDISIGDQTIWNDTTRSFFPKYPAIYRKPLSRIQNPIFIVTWKNAYAGSPIGTTEFKRLLGYESSSPTFYQTPDNQRLRGIFYVRIPDVTENTNIFLNLELGSANTDIVIRGFTIPMPPGVTYVRTTETYSFPIRTLEPLHHVVCQSPEGGWPSDELPVSSYKINFKRFSESTDSSTYGQDRAGTNPAIESHYFPLVSFHLMGTGWVKTLTSWDGTTSTPVQSQCISNTKYMMLRTLYFNNSDTHLVFHTSNAQSELLWGLFTWMRYRPTSEDLLEDLDGTIPYYGIHS